MYDPKLTAGKCPACSKRYKRVVAYQWKAGPRRRVRHAVCRTCFTVRGESVELVRTCLANAKGYHLKDAAPLFRESAGPYVGLISEL